MILNGKINRCTRCTNTVSQQHELNMKTVVSMYTILFLTLTKVLDAGYKSSMIYKNCISHRNAVQTPKIVTVSQNCCGWMCRLKKLTIKTIKSCL